MNWPSSVAILDILNRADLSVSPILKIVVLRNITIEPIELYLRYGAYQMGFNGLVQFGDYDNIIQNVIGEEGILLNKETDCVLVFMKLETLSWNLARNFAGLAPQDIQAERTRIQDSIRAIVSGIRRKTSAMILWQGFELPTYPALGIYDSQINLGQMAVISALNNFCRDHLQQHPNAYFVDTNLCLSLLGANRYYDSRFWHISRAPYTREAFREITKENFRYIRALKGKNKKCLVLDCDDTLWGGIIGEDGLAGIRLGKTHPGSAYYEFQQEIVNLYHRGIIIALCSKNNEEDVWEVFRNHPDMVLKEDHIATAQINWQDKVTNLKRIATDLNIGLDSLVFVDDSEFEANLVRDQLPTVEVLHLPKHRAMEYAGILASCAWFDTLTISDEDKKRGAMYKAQTSRKRLQSEITDLQSYLESLEMTIEIRFVDEFSVPRVAQLTQKTNQFNLTTRRYSEADIQSLAKSDQSDVLFLKLTDKFGDSGIVGVCILKYSSDQAVFDTFLLSCRVLGRGVEEAFLLQALKLAKKSGCREARGEFYMTKKNSQVENFYSKQGFQEIEKEKGKADKVFLFDLTPDIRPEPAFFKKIVTEI